MYNLNMYNTKYHYLLITAGSKHNIIIKNIIYFPLQNKNNDQ